MFFSKKLQKFKNIKHCFFSRKNGVSKGIYESLNCGIGSKDQEENVKKNLDIVSKKFNIKKDSLALMHQTHSNKVEIIVKRNNLERIKCDAMLTKDNEIALSVLTADCLPILIYEKRKEIIGCIHAGWKGAVNGIIENTLKKLEEMNGSIKQLVVSLGPCISQKNYEVKNDFYSEFIKKSKNNDSFFFKNEKKTFNFDLRGFVIKKFKDLGVLEIDNVAIDSFASENEYFSHRRAKKLGQDDYGRCISVIRKISSQN
jgi:YfiH family protein